MDGSEGSFLSSPESIEGGGGGLLSESELMGFKHAELKAMCKDRGLHVTGTLSCFCTCDSLFCSS